MGDNLTPRQRKRTMSRVKSKDTGPEMIVRREAFRLGYRYRLHRKDLPGKPDMVFSGRRKIIFVHGCFWHGHKECPASKRPASNTSYWTKKLDGNIARDRKNQKILADSGWDVLIIWECQTRDMELVTSLLKNFLDE